MKGTDVNLEKMLKYLPEEGKLLLGGDRMILFRKQAMAALKKLLWEQVGQHLSRAILTQFGYHCGQGDYHSLMKDFEWDEDMDRLISGPTLQSWEGNGKAITTRFEYDREQGVFDMEGYWINSYEAEIHLEEFGPSDEPVCHTMTGYASGWSSLFFGKPVLAIETSCVAKGDASCGYKLLPDSQWGEEANPWRQALSSTTYSISKELEEKLVMIEAQRIAIAQLSTPILQVWEGILCLPVIGTVDTARSAEMTDKLLEEVIRLNARAVVVDLTGIDVVDTKTADHFIKMVKSVKLLGAKAIITGISPSIAQTLTYIGVDMHEIETMRNLQDGLKLLVGEKM